MSSAEIKQSLETNYKTLIDLCQNNANYFYNRTSKTAQLINSCLVRTIDEVESLWLINLEIQNIAPKYHFDENVPGNGFYTFLIVSECAFNVGIDLNKCLNLKRTSIFFKNAEYLRRCNSCLELFTNLVLIGNNLKKLSGMLDEELFITHVTSTEFYSDLEKVDSKSFYGPNLGFQFCSTIQPIMRTIHTFITVLSEMYYDEHSSWEKLSKMLKYIQNPEERADRIIRVYYNTKIEFLKMFWFANENDLADNVAAIKNSKVAISKILRVPLEPLVLTVNNKRIDVPIPKSFIGDVPIQVRLIAYKKRQGMLGMSSNKNKTLPPSRGLIFHCHGGGFTAQTSKSHECYLRVWAKLLNVPILSIDYSLIPEAPFPRALEEITYAYCWALNNLEYLGTTGERIVFVGDSAGANLLTALVNKCITIGLPKPSGVLLVYAAFMLNFYPNPSKQLCYMDPLLHMQIVNCILKEIVPLNEPQLEMVTNTDNDYKTEEESANKNDATSDNEHRCEFAKPKNSDFNISLKTSKCREKHVLGKSTDDIQFDETRDKILLNNYHLNSLFTPDNILQQYPPIKLLTTHLDPFIDDSVAFATKLRKVGVDVGLDVLNGLPHGFLNFCLLCKESMKQTKLCSQRLSELLSLETLSTPEIDK